MKKELSTSCVVRARDFREDWFELRRSDLGPIAGSSAVEMHRKVWEFCAIAQVYEQKRGGAVDEIKAIGFGVGKDPLVSLFSLSAGEVVATDPVTDSKQWTDTGQQAKCKEDLYQQIVFGADYIAAKARFDRVVAFENVNMNTIPDKYKKGEYDFSWSCGAMEHTGSIRHTFDFLVDQMKCLKPGGICAHTTELNVTPDRDDTLNGKDLCLFREKDLKRLVYRLESRGFRVWPLDLEPGTEDADIYVDEPPYEQKGSHLRLRLGAYVSTSVLLVIEKVPPVTRVVTGEDKFSVLLVGDAVNSTGFSRCMHVAADELYKREHTVNVLGMGYDGDPHKYPYDIYPTRSFGDRASDVFGVQRLPILMSRLKSDVVVFLNDPWNVAGYMEYMEGVKVDVPATVAWLAVDSKNQRGREVNMVDHAVVWTQFGREQLIKGGYEGSVTISGLGVDKDVFYPVSDKATLRKEFLPEFARDGFIVGCVGRNQPRKRLDAVLESFAVFAADQKHVDTYLFLHVSGTGEYGVDIQELVNWHGLKGKVLLHQLKGGHAITDDGMRSIYNLMDVYVTCSQGEGWGLCTHEAMACGVECIVPDCGGLASWVGDNAVRVPCTGNVMTAPINASMHTVGGAVDVGAMADAIGDVYGKVTVHGDRPMKHAREYSWERTGREFADDLEQFMALVR